MDFLNYIACFVCCITSKNFTIKEENIYDKLIEGAILDYNYKEASSIVNHTIDKGYDDDRTYYLKGLITAATSSRAEGMADWERGLKPSKFWSFEL